MERAGGWRPDSNLPEVALAGRSNVGKSALINKLLGRRAMARVSRSPGRTRQVNFFRVNDQFVLADLPGYGYARIAREQRERWGPLIEDYLQHTPNLRGILQLLDLRRDPTEDDLSMLGFAANLGLPAVVVATKADKLSRAAAASRVGELAEELGLEETAIIAFSAHTGAGRDNVARAIEGLVSTRIRQC
jgi:GTP-binding protein